MNRPLVSVIIPSYNHEEFVQEAINSIIAQDYKNIELIIIDDGSEDDSVEKIKELVPICRQRFSRFEFRNRGNKGLCATLNEALDWCKGEYYSLSASDDISLPTRVSRQVELLEKNISDGVVGIFVGVTVIDANKNIIKIRGSNDKFGFKKIFLRKTRILGSAVMLVRKSVLSVGGYDENLKIEDFSLLLSLASRGASFISIKEPLVYYRRHGRNFSANIDEMWNSVNDILNKYKNHPCYQQAVSCNVLQNAHNIQVVSKKLAIYWMIRALKIYPLNFFSKSCLWLLVKFFR